MENENYYEKLKESHTIFKSLSLDKGQQERLRSLLNYSFGAISSLRRRLSELSQDAIHNEQFKKEKLNEVKAELQSTLDREYKSVQNRFTLTQQALRNATHQEPKDSSEALLRFMQQQEIRDNLRSLPSAKRTEILLDTVEAGNPAVLRAVESQPVTSDLVPSDVLDRASKTYAQKIAPQQTEAVSLAKADLEAAEKVRNLVQVALGYIEQNL